MTLLIIFKKKSIRASLGLSLEPKERIISPMYITNEDDVKMVTDVILSKRYFRNRGKGVVGHCRQFEMDFAQIMGVRHSLMVTSGTNALICALQSLDLQEGDEVILPCYTYFATAVAVVHAKATPVIVNIDQKLMIDPLEVERAITPRTKAIIAVHMDGHPCQMSALKKLATDHHLALIEDVAQACGGSYQGKRLGSIGDMGCFSFNADKILSCGEGGALITNSDLYYQKSLCVQDACCLFGPTFKDSFTEIEPFIGQSMRVSEISGALMQVQLSRLDQILEKLRRHKNILMNEMESQQLEVIKAWDEAGDCGTSLFVKFSSPDRAQAALLSLAQNQIPAVSISMRPAHASWQWGSLLAKERPEGKYQKARFLTSIDLLMSSLKIPVPFEATEEEVSDLARKVSHIIKAVL